MTTKQPTLQLTQKFIKGLKQHNLSLDMMNNWKYCGGNEGRHLNYYRIFFPGKDTLPASTDECICGHPIVENCYITNGERILVLGNCCIKKFIPKSSRTCQKCGEPHKNRIVNRCNDCRVGVCDICNKQCNPKYKKCYNCAFSD